MADFEKSVATFHNAHQSILESLEEIQTVIRSRTQLRGKIADFQEKLLFYFSLQNNDFFESVSERYQEDARAAKMLEALGHDLTDIKMLAMDFFDQCSSSKVVLPGTIPVEFMSLAKLLKTRISLEQDYLLPLLKKLK